MGYTYKPGDIVELHIELFESGNKLITRQYTIPSIIQRSKQYTSNWQGRKNVSGNASHDFTPSPANYNQQKKEIDKYVQSL